METLAQLAEKAYKAEKTIIQTVELDGITYQFSGYVTLQENGYEVYWACNGNNESSHEGQAEIAQYKWEPRCCPDKPCLACLLPEQQYWDTVKLMWETDLKEFGVTWNPQLTF